MARMRPRTSEQILAQHARPVRFVELVEVVRWRCATPGHRHVSQKTAQDCINTLVRPRVQRLDFNPQAVRKLFLAALDGTKLDILGEQMGCTRSRIHQILKQAMRTMTAGNPTAWHWHYTPSLTMAKRHRKFWLQRLDAVYPPNPSQDSDKRAQSHEHRKYPAS